ncbi:MAG: hypothetical protein JST93_05345 [Acidobacteria bacterium]|nr:hypothetical protein [Acidobacteriota bacterium]
MLIPRRHLLQLTAGVPLTRAAAQITPNTLRFASELEPLVALLESTPREKCAAMAVQQLRKGTPYKQLLAATFLAGIRNVNPRPPGFALHCVFVIHSAHRLSLEAPSELRSLPLFYAIDNFKTAQDRDAKASTGDYTMCELTQSLPTPTAARTEFANAMDHWDIERAERAAAALARHNRTEDAFSLLWEYGARDYRNIGHKAIFTANAYRTLHTIGLQHAEPVLRSIALGLLDFTPTQEMNGYTRDNQCYASNKAQVKSLLKANPGAADATAEILTTLRQAPLADATRDIAARIAKSSASPQSIWDAIHLSAAELAMRCHAANTIVGIHAVSAANALRHAWQSSTSKETKLLLTLQAAGWMVQFRTFAESRPNAIRPLNILALTNLPNNRHEILNTTMQHTFLKADEVHYFKYLAALIEDSRLVSPQYQPSLLAAIPYYAKTQADPITPAMRLAQDELRSA